MKKIICLLLAVLLLAGCGQRDSGRDLPTEAELLPTETTLAPTETVIREETTGPALSRDPIPELSRPSGSLTFSNTGKTRIAYKGNVAYVKYITSVDQLPDEEALQGYDAAYFENNALLIVVETVTSGSVRLEIDAINIHEDVASVKVKRTMAGDVGTADMATWLLWAEVEQGLDYTWRINDRIQPTEGEKY